MPLISVAGSLKGLPAQKAAAHWTDSNKISSARVGFWNS
jgi:hypothetical protein